MSELQPGRVCVFYALLAERRRNLTRDGKLYITCYFRDASRVVKFLAWADTTWYETCERDWREGAGYKILGVLSEHERFGAHIDIQDIRPVEEKDKKDGYDPAALVEHSRHDPEEMFKALCLLAEQEIADRPLSRLVLLLLQRYCEILKILPATTNKFHPFRGGLLEHLLSVARTSLFLVDHYRTHYSEHKPPLNRDVVLAGAILHDIGRVAELNPETFPAQPTVPGRLFGHIFLGRDLVRDAARELGDVDSELLQLLEHVIITHLTLPEWGSPRLPLIPETLILHHADDLDAKVEMYIRCLTRDLSTGPFTERDPMLNRQLYKGRRV